MDVKQIVEAVLGGTQRKPRAYIFAGDADQFDDYVHRSGRDPLDYVYLGPNYGDQLRDAYGVEVIRVGTWYTREDTDALAIAFSQGAISKLTTERN